MIAPIAPATKKAVLEAARTDPRSYAQIAVDWGVGESTIRRFAREAGIHRRAGRKPKQKVQ